MAKVLEKAESSRRELEKSAWSSSGCFRQQQEEEQEEEEEVQPLSAVGATHGHLCSAPTRPVKLQGPFSFASAAFQ